LITYPLYPYLKLEQLKQKIALNGPTQGTLGDIHTLEEKYPDFPFTQSLKNAWLKQAAKYKNWALYVKEYQPRDKEELECHYLFGQYQLTKDKAYLAKAEKLWLVGYAQPASCEPLFKAWKNTTGISKSLIWQRIKLALDEKNAGFANQLNTYLSVSERSALLHWQQLLKNPALLNHETFLNKIHLPTNIKVDMLSQALKLLAKKSPEKALAWWNTHQHHYAFTAKQVAQIESDIGIYLSHQRSPLAQVWLSNPEHHLSTVAKEWRIRLALGNLRWQEALHWIEQLPENAKQESCWQYWQARAYFALGQKDKALTLYEQLAKSRNYYGFLASIRLNRPVTFQWQTITPENAVFHRVSALPSMQRFHELLALKRKPQARVEWFKAIQKLEDLELIAAAKIALQHNLNDYAIFTMTKSKHKDDMNLRFLLGFKDDIVDNANKHNLDPAWVFAITRQESAFYSEVISHAGARGLMQLLPTTASLMAKKYDIPLGSDQSLHTPSVNIQLGTAYLKNLKQRVSNHILLATAAYNAGPERALRWLPEKSLDADIWIDNIPYKETREYLKNVVTFTSIYRHRLGYPPATALLMKPIPAKGAKNT